MLDGKIRENNQTSETTVLYKRIFYIHTVQRGCNSSVVEQFVCLCVTEWFENIIESISGHLHLLYEYF